MEKKKQTIKKLKTAPGVKFADDSDSSLPEAFEGASGKIRISMFIDTDLLKTIKKTSLDKGMRYQTLIHNVLYEHFQHPVEFALKE